MSLLKTITYTLPSDDQVFHEQFITYLSSQAQKIEKGIELNISKEAYLPKTFFQFTGNKNPYVTFSFEAQREITVSIENTTTITKKNPSRYSHITFEEFIKRMEHLPIVGLDHTGFNLPYFDGIHPRILALRKELKDACLYHTFPKHLEDAPWDFIIPGTKEEINRSLIVDYNQTRKPKFEIVSFEKASTPLIQIDIQVQGKYKDFVAVFPEAIDIPEIKCIWIYVKNNFGIDICFVVNEASEKDWSYEFSKERIE